MKEADSRDPYQVQSPVVVGSANLEVNCCFLFCFFFALGCKLVLGIRRIIMGH